MSESAAAKARVLFLCVHNAGRSQMAEGLLRHLGAESFVVESAGFEPRAVLPEAVQAMSLIGIDIAGARSKSVFDLYKEGRVFDYVIAVCDEASAERCPIFPGVCERLQWAFPDPSAVRGSDAERLEQVVQIRDQIKRRVEDWLVEKRATGIFPQYGRAKV